MQKNSKYWLLNLGCIAVLATLFIVQKNIQGGTKLSGQVSTSSALCTEMSGYWKFDSSTGSTVVDSSGNSNDLTFVSLELNDWSQDTSSNIQFWNQGSFHFPGNGHVEVQTGTNLKLTGDMTLSLWIKPTVLGTTTESNVLMSFGSATVEGESEYGVDNYVYAFSINGTSKALRMMWENGTNATDVVIESSLSSNINAGSWYHLAVTKDASEKEIQFYVNGTPLGAVQQYSLLPSGGTGANTFYIGVGPHDPSTTYFNGIVDDARVYAKTLTEEHISTIFAANDTLVGCTCGNGYIEPPEVCDDGNTSNLDECTSTCVEAVCGDGYVQTSLGEQCDPPGTASCAADCTLIDNEDEEEEEPELTIPPNCGNRIVNENEGEECDEGHLNGSGECSQYCTILYCGDAILSPEINEECEPEPTSYVNGEPMFTEPTCGNTCAIPDEDGNGGCARLFLPPCQASEVLKNSEPDATTGSTEETGSTSSESLKSAASTEPVCGNAIVDAGEDCDNGGLCEGGSLDGSTVQTEEEVTECLNGEGVVTPISNDGCSVACTFEFCGDGIVQPAGEDGRTNTFDDEQCDNGSVCSNDLEVSCTTDEDCTGRCMYNYTADTNCTNACTLLSVASSSVESLEAQTESSAPLTKNNTSDAVCGNFVVEVGEECDEGILNSDDQPNACRTSCVLPVCGDGIRDSGEDCDGGPTCKKDCTFPTLSVCGNGIVEGKEKCDDGNVWPGDGCNSQCLVEVSSSSASSFTSISSETTSLSSEPASSDTAVAGVQSIVSSVAISSQASSFVIPIVTQGSSSLSAFTLQPIQYQRAVVQALPTASVIRYPVHSPVGDTGPGAVIAVAAGAAGGFLWKRKRKS